MSKRMSKQRMDKELKSQLRVVLFIWIAVVVTALISAIGTFVYIDRGIDSLVQQGSVVPADTRGGASTPLKVTTRADYIKHKPAVLQEAAPESRPYQVELQPAGVR